MSGAREENLKQNFKFHPALTLVIFSLFIALWSRLYLALPLNIDTGWLLSCLDRFMSGGTYGADFYETNPPLSFLIYLPAYPFYNDAPINAPVAVFALFMMYIGLSNIILYALLRHINCERALIIPIITAILMAETWAAGLSFGTKDHLIFIFLLPFSLLQYCITRQETPSKSLTILATCLGGIALCLKPHYAIIPAIFFLHRLFVTRAPLTLLRSPDFIGLLAIAFLYLAFIYALTPAYLNIILPEVLTLYNLDKPFPITTRLPYLLFTMIAITLGFLISRKEPLRHIIFALAALSLLCVLPYLLQDKGFQYHALPFLSFGICALFLSSFALAKSIARHTDIALWSACSLIAALCFSLTTGGKNKYLNANQLIAQPLIEEINTLAWNKTYATYDMKSMLSALPYMLDLKDGARFGQIWPLFSLSQHYENTSDMGERANIKREMNRYVDMLAADIARYRPSVITIPQYRQPGTEETNQNYLHFLMSNEHFKKSMAQYQFKKSIPFDTSLTDLHNNPDKIIVHDLYVLEKGAVAR